MSTTTKEATRKYKLSSSTVNYLASVIDVDNGDSILYHKLNKSFFNLLRGIGITPNISLTDTEVRNLFSIIDLKITGKSYCSLSDKEMLIAAKKKLSYFIGG